MFSKQAKKSNMFIQLCTLLLLFTGIRNICCENVIVNSTDVLSLLDFKQSIINPGVIMSNWNKSTSLCQWNGVICSLKHPGQVTGLNLSGQSLSGPIAASVGNLSSLRTLDLSSNHFYGPIPHLNNLQHLRFLNLSYNSLVGSIPDTLVNCSKLTHIDFYNNYIEGKIPLKLDLLPNLFDLVLSVNNLTGTIPLNLGNITHAQRIALADNDLTGSIPQGLWKLPNLLTLVLGGNKLSGEIPQVLFNQSSLSKLGLDSNMLSGALPSNIGNAFPNLQLLFLGGNTFQGHIPASLGNASKLVLLDLSTNNFTGEIPSSFGKLPNISVLNFESNSLEAKDSQSWEFFSALTNCTQLNRLSLSMNQLAGVIPDSVGNLSSKLQYLLLGRNKLSGTVPPSVGNLQSLIELGLEGNDLSGTTENWIGKLTQLQVLTLQRNSFTGLIPSSIGALTQLSNLQLASNRFEGPIPPSLGNLEEAVTLDLSNNNLQGNIPLEISKLVSLGLLNLSSNMLSGEIPRNWGNFKRIQKIEMERNFLEGNIPESFGSLLSLELLNLSHNNLSGLIPTLLSDLQFSMIDLSYNHLQGQVPRNGIFKNSTAVSLDGNWGLCGGAMVFHFSPCSRPFDKIKTSYYLIRVLIPIFGFMSLLLTFYLICIEKKILRKADLPLDNLFEHFPKVSYKDLAQATKNFSESNLIGRGSCGSVYRGKLKESKMEVAVKVFDLEMGGAERSFISECEALRSIQHRNLLSILTACSTVDNTGNVFKALIYEFMPNGNLDTWLHRITEEGKSPKCLGLNQRISIAVNIADALDYLHHDCGRPTVHCDLKPSNILLDDEMTALLADFGIARFYAEYSSTTTGLVTSVGLKGTIGYIAPECAHGGHVSTAGDVYSFGILLLEMTTGKRPTDPMFTDGLDIISFVERSFPHQISKVIDAKILEECGDLSNSRMEAENVAHKCLVSLLELALHCTRSSATERPNMKQIARGMHAIKTSYRSCESNKKASE